ncbi:hypothetical protein [Enterobacter ludwigii]|uniref:hypothetical protein n=1 Tax=Enterobacter ludwigii TaxID=299767 RepID=UPI0006435AA6|nr:hypothetical protein [Enterobacter ludwigii]KLP39482.1 hypothetical protein ABR36_10745 [Enterobacter ludwigii]
MAKLPKKVIVADEAKATTLRDFVSAAAHKPATASRVTRANFSLTDEDLACSDLLQNKLSLSRVEIFRAGMLALERVPDDEQKSIADEIKRRSPKAGRPSVKK